MNGDIINAVKRAALYSRVAELPKIPYIWIFGCEGKNNPLA
jgi:hypothetical protein